MPGYRIPRRTPQRPEGSASVSVKVAAPLVWGSSSPLRRSRRCGASVPTQPMIRRVTRVRAAGVEPERDAHRGPLEGRQDFHGRLALEAAANNDVVRGIPADCPRHQRGGARLLWRSGRSGCARTGVSVSGVRPAVSRAPRCALGTGRRQRDAARERAETKRRRSDGDWFFPLRR